MKSTEAAAAVTSHYDDSSSTIKDQSRMVIASMISSLASTTAESTDNLSNNNNNNPSQTLSSSLEQQKKKKTTRRRFHHHLVLHFDINETILVGDEAGGDSREDCINKMLAKSAFVRMMPSPTTATAPGWSTDTPIVMIKQCSFESTSSMEPTHWWDGTPIALQDEHGSSSSRTSILPSPQSQSPPPLYIGWQWPPGCCPYYRTKYKKRSKTFTENNNNDGSIYRPTYKLLDDKLQTFQQHIVDVAKTITTSVAIQEAPSEQKGPVPSAETLEVLSHMLPSFFETLLELSKELDHSSDSSRRRLTLVFRTMGTDLFKIAHAINAFAQGQHPDYPNFYNNDFILSPDQIVQGRWKQVDTTTTTSASTKHDKDDDTESTTLPNVVYQLYKYKDRDEGDDGDDNDDINDDDLLIASGDVEVLDFIHSHTICGIQDDYRFWKRHGHEPFAGKPVWKIVPNNIDPSSSSNHHDLVQHVLLDDNIHNLPHDSIASVRQVVGMTTSGNALHCCNNGKVKESTSTSKRLICVESLTGPEIQEQHGLHLIRVPTVAPLLDSTWFMTQIHQAQERFAQLYYDDDDDDR